MCPPSSVTSRRARRNADGCRPWHEIRCRGPVGALLATGLPLADAIGRCRRQAVRIRRAPNRPGPLKRDLQFSQAEPIEAALAGMGAHVL